MIQWEALAGVAGHMDIKYEGGDADRNLIDSLQYSKSLEGSSRLYRLIAADSMTIRTPIPPTSGH